jgi:hypothetical protein
VSTSHSANKRTCDEALRAFAARRFADWRGLPACTLADIRRHFELLDDEPHPGQLGRRAASWTAMTVEGYDEPVQLWFDEQHVLLLLAEYPELPDWPALAKKLGEPAAKLDSHLSTLLIPGSEWVYPGRGISLFVNPENMALLRVAVYAPATLAEYEAGLRLRFKQRRLPDGDGE